MGEPVRITAFGQWLKKTIKESGLPQGVFAARLDLADSVISRWIYGRNMPRYDTMEEILDELGYHIEFIKNEEK